MKLSHRWLSRYVPDLPSPERVAVVLQQLGIEVAAMEPWGERLRAIELVEVVRRDPHPRADRLYLVSVRRGTGEVLSVVTGASNGFPGDRLWYGPAGTVLADGHVLGVRDFRGVTSPGMLLSPEEAGFSAEPGDLWVWRQADAVGSTLLDVLRGPDWVYDLELTPNLAIYYQSVRNIAHDAAAVAGWTMNDDREPFPFGQSTGLLRVESRADCPLYGLVALDLVPGAVTPLWMQALLRATGQRPIHPAVDVTNFVLWDCGQPLHAFDRDRVVLPIAVRRALPGESLTLLDGTVAALTSADLVIADGHGPIALAGVMGGAESAIRPDTTRILLESAHFSAPVVFRTLRARQLPTDAALHFGKGTDAVMAAAAPARVLAVMAADGLLAGVGDSAILGEVPRQRVIPFEPETIRTLLGVAWSDERVSLALERLGFGVARDLVTIPSWRHDVEGSADLAEEVARYYGLDTILPRLPRMAASPGKREPEQEFLERLRDLWAQAGYWEVATRTFSSEERERTLNRPTGRQPLQLANPLRNEESRLRTDLLTSLLEVFQFNRSRRDRPIAMFEVASVFAREGERVVESVELAVVESLDPVEQFPHGPRPSIYDLKGALEWVAAQLGWELSLSVPAQIPAFLHPGRSLAIAFTHDPQGGGGWLGELRPRTAQGFQGRRVAVLTMRADRPASPRPRGVMAHPSRFPEIVRDLSLVVPEPVTFDEVQTRIGRTGSADLRQTRLIDRFEGDFGVSLTVRLTFQSDAETLTDQAVEEEVAHILSELAGVGVVLRQ